MELPNEQYSNSWGDFVDKVKNVVSKVDPTVLARQAAAKLKAAKDKAKKDLAKLDLTNKNSDINKLLAKTDLTNKNVVKGLAKDARVAMGKFNKYNPGAIIPRSSALVAFRFNVFGLSRKLYPALLTDAELTAKHFDLENAKKVRVAWEKVKKIWTDIGGSVAALEKDIRKGHEKPIFKTKKTAAAKRQESGIDGDLTENNVLNTLSTCNEYSNFAGYDDAAIAGYISLGLSILGMIGKAIQSTGAKKNPYVEGSKEAASIDTDGDGVPDVNKADYDAIMAAAAKDRANGLPPADMEIGTGVPTWVYAVGGTVLVLGVVLLVVKLTSKK